MRIRSLSKFGLTTALSLSLALFGCGDGDDSPTDPGGGGGSTLTDSEAVMAADFATPAAVALAEQAVAVASLDPNGLAGGPSIGFSLLGRELPARALAPSWSLGWDGDTQEYVGIFSDDQLPASDTYFEHRVQYLDAAGAPQAEGTQSAETTDGARHITDSRMFMDMGLVLQEPGLSGTVDVQYGATSTLAGLQTGAWTVVSSGNYAIDVDMTVEQDGQTQQAVMDIAMQFALDVGITPAGCPEGTASMTYPGYRVDMSFDGSSSAAWSLTRLDDGAVILSGTEAVLCGQTAR